MTIYRKVLCSERLPEKTGNYITNIGLNTRFKDNTFNKTTGLGGIKILIISWWLEEIELPSEQDLNKRFGRRIQAPISLSLYAGAEYILNKLK